MSDNQQQQQMNVDVKRSVGEMLALGAGGATLAILFIKALHWAAPEWFPPEGGQHN